MCVCVCVCVCVPAPLQLSLMFGGQLLSELCVIAKATAPPEEVRVLRAEATRGTMDLGDVDVVCDGVIDRAALAPSQIVGVNRLYEAAQRELTARGMQMIDRYRKLSNQDLAEVGLLCELCCVL